MAILSQRQAISISRLIELLDLNPSYLLLNRNRIIRTFHRHYCRRQYNTHQLRPQLSRKTTKVRWGATFALRIIAVLVIRHYRFRRHGGHASRGRTSRSIAREGIQSLCRSEEEFILNAKQTGCRIAFNRLPKKFCCSLLIEHNTATEGVHIRKIKFKTKSRTALYKDRRSRRRCRQRKFGSAIVRLLERRNQEAIQKAIKQQNVGMMNVSDVLSDNNLIGNPTSFSPEQSSSLQFVRETVDGDNSQVCTLNKNYSLYHIKHESSLNISDVSDLKSDDYDGIICDIVTPIPLEEETTPKPAASSSRVTSVSDIESDKNCIDQHESAGYTSDLLKSPSNDHMSDDGYLLPNLHVNAENGAAMSQRLQLSPRHRRSLSTPSSNLHVQISDQLKLLKKSKHQESMLAELCGCPDIPTYEYLSAMSLFLRHTSEPTLLSLAPSIEPPIWQPISKQTDEKSKKPISFIHKLYEKLNPKSPLRRVSIDSFSESEDFCGFVLPSTSTACTLTGSSEPAATYNSASLVATTAEPHAIIITAAERPANLTDINQTITVASNAKQAKTTVVHVKRTAELAKTLAVNHVTSDNRTASVAAADDQTVFQNTTATVNAPAASTLIATASSTTTIAATSISASMIATFAEPVANAKSEATAKCVTAETVTTAAKSSVTLAPTAKPTYCELRTPHIPFDDYSSGSGAFVSNTLDTFLEENSVTFNLAAMPKIIATEPFSQLPAIDAAIVTDTSEPPPLDCPVRKLYSDRPRTLAEKRLQMIQKADNVQEVMLDNASYIYRALKRRAGTTHKTRQTLANHIGVMRQQQVPFDRDYWRAASWLCTSPGRFYYQIVTTSRGVELSLPGGCGDFVERCAFRFPLDDVSLRNAKFAAVNRRCQERCSSFGRLRVSNLNEWMRKVYSNTSVAASGHRRMIATIPNARVTFRPCPLSKKTLNANRESLDSDLGPLQIIKMPNVQLEVMPRIDRPQPAHVRTYLNMVAPTDCITGYWAQFAVSTLRATAPDTAPPAIAPTKARRGQLLGRSCYNELTDDPITDTAATSCNASPAVMVEFDKQPFCFDIPYANNQTSLLVRRRYKQVSICASQNDGDALDVLNAANGLADALQFDRYVRADDAVALQVAEVLRNMMNAVSVACMEERSVCDDPDLGSNNKMVIDRVKTTKATATQHSIGSRKSLLRRELKRLDATVIDISKVDCNELFCRLGCVCDSLAVHKNHQLHCRRVECMFACSCSRQSIIALDHRNRIIEQKFQNANAHLAKEQREFRTTVVLSEDRTICIPNRENVGKRITRVPRRYHEGNPDENSTPPMDSMAAKRRSDDGIVEPQDNAPLDDHMAADQVDSHPTDDEQQHVLNHFGHCAVLLERLPDVVASLQTWCMEHHLYKCGCMLRATDTVDDELISARADSISQKSASARNKKQNHSSDRMKKIPTPTLPPTPFRPFTSPPSPPQHQSPEPSPRPSALSPEPSPPLSALSPEPRTGKFRSHTQMVGSKRQQLQSELQQVREFGLADPIEFDKPCIKRKNKDGNESNRKRQRRNKVDARHLSPEMSLIDTVVDVNEIADILAQEKTWPLLDSNANLISQSKLQLNQPSDNLRSCINNSMCEIFERQRTNNNICHMTRSDVMQWNYFRQQFYLDKISLWEVRIDMNNVWLCLTLAGVVPQITDALSVKNVERMPLPRLPLLAQLLFRKGFESPQSDQLALLICPKTNYWRIVSLIFSRVNYLSDNSVKVSTSETNDPIISTKIDALLKMVEPNSRTNQPIVTNIPMSVSRSANRLFLPLPEVGDFRWLMLKLGRDFTHILIPSCYWMVTYQQLADASKISRDNVKTVKISVPNIVPDVYVSANAPNMVFFGPYGVDETMDIQLLCKHDGQYIANYDYEKIVRPKTIVRTVGCWLMLTKEKVLSANRPEYLTSDMANADIDDCTIIETPESQPMNNMQMVAKSLLPVRSLVTVGEECDTITEHDNICLETLSKEEEEPQIFRASASAAVAAQPPNETLLRVKKQINKSQTQANKSFDAEMVSASSTQIVNERNRCLLISNQPPTIDVAVAKIPVTSLEYDSLQLCSTNAVNIPSSPQPQQQLPQSATLHRRNSVLLRPMRSMLQGDRDSVLLQPATRLAKASATSVDTFAPIAANAPKTKFFITPLPPIPTSATNSTCVGATSTDALTQQIGYIKQMPQPTASTSSTLPAVLLHPVTACAPHQVYNNNSIPSLTGSNASHSSAAVATVYEDTTSMVHHPDHPQIRSITIRTPKGMTMLRNSAGPTNRKPTEADRSSNMIYQNTTTSSHSPIISNVFSAETPNPGRAAVAGQRRSTVSVSMEERPLSVEQFTASIQRRLPSTVVVTASTRTPQQLQQQTIQHQEQLPLAILTKIATRRKQSTRPEIQPQPMPNVTFADPLPKNTVIVVLNKQSSEPPVDKRINPPDSDDTATTSTNQSCQLMPQPSPVPVPGWMVSNHFSALGRIQALSTPLGVRLLLYDIGSGANKWTEWMPSSEMVNKRARQHILQFVYAFQPVNLKMLWRFVFGDRLSDEISDMQEHAPQQWPYSMVVSEEAGLIDLKYEIDVNGRPPLSNHSQVELNMLRLAFVCEVDRVHLRNLSRQFILNAVSGPTAECSASIEQNGDDNVCVCFVCEQLAEYVRLQNIKDNESLMSIATIAHNIRMNKTQLRDLKMTIRNGKSKESTEIIEIDDDEDE